jgi:hypothetical protein
MSAQMPLPTTKQYRTKNAETVVPNAGTAGNPFYNSSWLAFEQSAPQQDSQTHLPPRLKHFSNLQDAFKTHMHLTHKLGNAGYSSYYKNLLHSEQKH